MVNFYDIDTGESVDDDYDFSDDVSDEDQQAFIESWHGGDDEAVGSLGWEFDDGDIAVYGKLKVEDLETEEEAVYPLQQSQSEPVVAEPEDFVDDEFANNLQNLKESKVLSRIKMLAGLK